MSNDTNTPAECGYVTGHTAGGGTARHIIARTGTHFNGYAAAAICGTAPEGRWGTGSSAIRWTVFGDIIYSTPAEAAAARTVCRRCAAAAAKMAAATVTPEAAPAESLDPADIRATELAVLSAPGARRVTLDERARMSTRALHRGARAVIMDYWTGAPGRENCADSVAVLVTGGDSHPARAAAAHAALDALTAVFPGAVTTGEYQTIARGSRDTIFIFGTWSN